MYDKRSKKQFGTIYDYGESGYMIYNYLLHNFLFTQRE